MSPEQTPPQPPPARPPRPSAVAVPGPRRRRRGGPPSSALIFVPPLVLSVGVVAVAALHGALGSPLGATWAAEVWDLAKTAITAMLAVTGFGAYAHTNNRRAWELAEADEARRTPPLPLPPASAPTARTPTSSRLTSAAMRQRRTGRLTPVESLTADAQVARAVEVTDRHAGDRGGPR